MNEHVCQNCNNSVEDEYHFTFECPLYADLRDHFWSLINEEDNHIIACSNPVRFSLLCLHYPRKFAKFICKIFEKRQSTLFT